MSFVHTKDSSSLQYRALLIFQELIAFHLHDARPDALLDVDLERLDYVKEHSTHPDKNTLYLNAVNHIANQYGSLPAAAVCFDTSLFHQAALARAHCLTAQWPDSWMTLFA